MNPEILSLLSRARHAQEGHNPMLTLEYKLDGTPAQYAAMDEGIRTVQFIRNKCLRAGDPSRPAGMCCG